MADFSFPSGHHHRHSCSLRSLALRHVAVGLDRRSDSILTSSVKLRVDLSLSVALFWKSFPTLLHSWSLLNCCTSATNEANTAVGQVW